MRCPGNRCHTVGEQLLEGLEGAFQVLGTVVHTRDQVGVQVRQFRPALSLVSVIPPSSRQLLPAQRSAIRPSAPSGPISRQRFATVSGSS